MGKNAKTLIEKIDKLQKETLAILKESIARHKEWEKTVEIINASK